MFIYDFNNKIFVLMSSIRAKRYAHPRIASAKLLEEKILEKQRSQIQIIKPEKTKQTQITKKVQATIRNPWTKLSSMTAWGFHGTYLELKQCVNTENIDNENMQKNKIDKKKLITVMNKRIKDQNAFIKNKSPVNRKNSNFSETTNVINNFFNKR